MAVFSLLFFAGSGLSHVLRMKDKEILSGSVTLSLHGCADQPSLSPRTGICMVFTRKHVRCQNESFPRLDFDPDSNQRRSAFVKLSS